MKQALIVGLGGAIGSIARYVIGAAVLQQTGASRFPFGTFVVNIVGCFTIGALAALAEHRGLFGPDTRLFLLTGLLGGFTTFSAFGYETLVLLRRGDTPLAMAYVLLSVLGGVAAVLAGFKLIGGAPHQ